MWKEEIRAGESRGDRGRREEEYKNGRRVNGERRMRANPERAK